MCTGVNTCKCPEGYKGAWCQNGKQRNINPLTAGPDYIIIFKCQILAMVNIHRDINQQDLQTVDLYFVKSE